MEICFIIFGIILSPFVFYIGGFIGKYFYYRAHISVGAYDLAWMWENRARFFLWDEVFYTYGIVAVVIFAVSLCLIYWAIRGILYLPGVPCLCAKKMCCYFCCKSKKKKKKSSRSKKRKRDRDDV